ncbi:hypothetical protein Tco_0334571, partial [Tanacetum coccineum]
MNLALCFFNYMMKIVLVYVAKKILELEANVLKDFSLFRIANYVYVLHTMANFYDNGASMPDNFDELLQSITYVAKDQSPKKQ